MAIIFFSGKPRGGKTLRAFWLIVEELKHGKRNVVTNIDIDLDALQWFMNEQGVTCDVFKRVTLLTPEEVPEFYRHRGSGVVLDMTGDLKAPIAIEASTEHPVCGLGVLYALDELHIFFNARRWKDTGDACLWYLSQHAKLGDDVYAITQSIGNVDKQFRSVAQEFRYLRNFAKEKFGRFKAGNYFEERTYMQPVTTMTDTACNVEKFKLPKDLAKCYRTAGGVGVPGGAAADVGRTAKGIPIWSLWVGLAVLLCGLWWGSDYFPALLNSQLGSLSGQAKKRVAAIPARNGPQMPPVPLPNQPTAPPETPEPARRVEVVGYALIEHGLPRVFLSDGRMLTEADGIAEIRPSVVVMRDGTRYAVQASKVRPLSPMKPPGV
jgi:hypothetical protein